MNELRKWLLHLAKEVIEREETQDASHDYEIVAAAPHKPPPAKAWGS